MKTILTTLLILTWMVGAGQSAMDAMRADTTSFLSTRSCIDDKACDTIPVIMQVCDTVAAKIWDVKTPAIYWINGYQVREAYTYWGGLDTEPGQMMVHAIAVRRTGYNHIKFLDTKKQPLRPEIVVWDYRRRHTNSTSR